MIKNILNTCLYFLIYLLLVGLGYFHGYNYNPKVHFQQLMRNTPPYAEGIKDSGWNFLSCDVNKLDKDKGEVILNKCNFKYITDVDKDVVRSVCNKDNPCAIQHK